MVSRETGPANAHELIVPGVRRVRNNYIHGQEFTDGRVTSGDDLTPVKETHVVLRAPIP
jgi:hypothetical protein